MTEKVTHEQLLEILCVFDAFCRKSEIPYTLHGGTLLGAIREQGFIPWDDDADVAMTRDAFNKLRAVLECADTGYYIKGSLKKQFCAKRDDRIWVDIFICDFISDNSVLRKMKQLLLTVLDIMHRDSESIKLSNFAKYSKMKQLAYKIAYLSGQIVPKQWTAKWYAAVSEYRFTGSRKTLFRSNDQYVGRMLTFPVEWMSEYKAVPFGDRELPVSVNYHDILSQCYGTDYMLPRQESRNEEVHNLIRSGEKIQL